MGEEQNILELSKDIGKVAASVEGLSATIIGLDDRFKQFEQYTHDRTHDIINAMQARDKRLNEIEAKLDKVCDAVDAHSPVIEDYQKLKNRGLGILFAVGVFGTALGWAVQSWLKHKGLL